MTAPETTPRKQCAKCPWKKSTNPRTIPNGYSEEKHRALRSTVADGQPSPFHTTSMMACHETETGAEKPCVGWLVQQLGPGNNLALRMRVLAGKVDANVKTVGPQHKRFEDTLPKPEHAEE